MKTCAPVRISLLAAFLLAASPAAVAAGSARIRGTIIGPEGGLIADLRISVTDVTSGAVLETLADGHGSFGWAALPQGRYVVSCGPRGAETAAEAPIDLGGFERLVVRLRLVSDGPEKGLHLDSVHRDPAEVASATTIDRDQLTLLPSGGSVWSVLENQDHSATTDRIDVGGMRSDIPALFSARGPTSWTQNVYRLNGLSVTDPYDGGLPFYIPDLLGLATIRLENGGHPAGVPTPGGMLDLVTKDGGDALHGVVTAFGGDAILTSSNITPALEAEGIREADTVKRSMDLHFDLSGPIVPGKLFFFTSLSALRITRDPAEVAEDDKGSVSTGLLQLRYDTGRSSWWVLWTGQKAEDSASGAGRALPFASTLVRKNTANILQARGSIRLSAGHVLSLGAGFNRMDISSKAQDAASGQPGINLTGGVSGPSAAAEKGRRELASAFVRGALSFRTGRTSHDIDYGAEIGAASATTRPEVPGGVLLRYIDGAPYEVVRYAPSVEHKETSLDAALHLQETLAFPNLVTISLGARASYTRARAGAGTSSIDWLHVAPRLGLVLPLSRAGRTSLKLFAGRYYHDLPLSWLAFGSPDAPGGLAYSWTDPNGNATCESAEQGALVRREGPLYGGIDPDIKRPRTDELSIGLAHAGAGGFSVSLTGYLRRSRDLVETLNTGVPFDSYSRRTVADIGDDRVAGNYDDLTFELFEQDAGTLGRDFLLLTNPDAETRTSHYEGLDLVLAKKTSSRFGFFVALTAMQCTGTTSPGSGPRENDDGVVGALYDDPNSLVNARGRLRFDRAYTGRIGFALRLPLGIRLGYILKYWDGQPFARLIAVTGFRQGPFLVMAHPRGVARYEFNMTNDVRVQKVLAIGGGFLRIILDGYNIFNQHLATMEDPRTRDEFPLRYATEIQSPRTFRLGLSYEF